MILFSTKKYEYLQKEFIKFSNFYKKGEIFRKTFSDGEIYTQIQTKFKNKDVALIGGTIDDTDIMELYDISCALVKLGAKSLTLIIPFFGYSTMERGLEEGEVVKAKTRARLLSLIPNAYQGNNIIMLDLHKEGITHYFENSVHAINIHAQNKIIDLIKSLEIENFAVGAVDEGGAKNTRQIADKFQVPALFVLKRRKGEKISLEATGKINKKIKNIILIDDMIRSGSSIINAVNAYSSDHEINFYVFATHGVFCNNGYAKIRQNKKIKKIIVSNSHFNVNKLDCETFSIVELVDKEIKDLIND